jgi:hypothetical protein
MDNEYKYIINNPTEKQVASHYAYNSKQRKKSISKNIPPSITVEKLG